MRFTTLDILTLVLAFCSMTYELLLAQCLSVILGHSMISFSLTIGFYLFSLGCGALLSERLQSFNQYEVLSYVELILAALGVSLPMILFFGDGVMSWLFFPGSLASSLFAYTLIVVIGLLSGIELPVLMHLAEERGGDPARILGLDFIATFIAAISFPFLIFEGLGLVAGAALTGGLNGLAAFFIFFCYRKNFWGLSISFFITVVAMGVFFEEEVVRSFIISFWL